VRPNSSGHRCRRRPRFKKLEKHLRRLRCTTLFVLLLLLVLSIAVLVLDAIQYSKPTHWSASYRESPRSTSGIAAVQTAIEYEYRFTEYRPPRRTEYEYDEIQCEARSSCRSNRIDQVQGGDFTQAKTAPQIPLTRRSSFRVFSVFRGCARARSDLA